MVDHILSDGDGVDLASEFLDIRPGIPVALYTGGALTIEEVQSRGISAVIPKVLTMEEFTEELKRVFDTE